jgi:hypothetical protein
MAWRKLAKRGQSFDTSRADYLHTTLSGSGRLDSAVSPPALSPWLPLILDILRNELPIFLITSGNTAHLGTATEPIGEGET